jgi:hypothetical protein
VTPPPEGRRIQTLSTTREFEGFYSEARIRATPNADSGVFIRRPQLQAAIPSAGPYKQLKQYKPGME